ncbi:hypothetical protein NBRC116587_19940 [Pseudoteredinibacter isoporae]
MVFDIVQRLSIYEQLFLNGIGQSIHSSHANPFKYNNLHFGTRFAISRSIAFATAKSVSHRNKAKTGPAQLEVVYERQGVPAKPTIYT